MTRRGFAAGGLAACAGLAVKAVAAPVLVEGPVASGDFSGHRAYPAGGLKSAPVLLFAPVARGRAAPLHREFAGRLARKGFYVITPDMIGGPSTLSGALAFAAAEGARIAGRGVLGYDGGVLAAHEALARDPGLRAGLAIAGPLGGNPIAGGLGWGRAGDRRMLSLDGRMGLLDPGSAERLLDEAVQRLVQNGLHQQV